MKPEPNRREHDSKNTLKTKWFAIVVIIPLVVGGSSYAILENWSGRQVVLPPDGWTMFQKDSRHSGFWNHDVKFGELSWTFEFPTEYPAGLGTAVIGQRMVFVEYYWDTGLAVIPPNVMYSLFALDAESGEIVWTHERLAPGFETRYSPLIMEDTIVVGVGGSVIAFAIDNGSILWSFGYGGSFGSPVGNSDIITVNCNHILYVLSADTGDEMWNFSFQSHIVSPTIDGSSIFVSDSNGDVFSFDSEGNVLWDVSLSEYVESPLTSDGDFIYLGSRSGTIYVIDKTDGSIVWKLPGFGEIHSSFAVSPDLFYFVTQNGTLYAFDKKSRIEVWSVSLDGDTYSSPVLGRNVLVLPSGNFIYFIEPNTGSILWEYYHSTQIPCMASSTATISSDLVVVGGCSDIAGRLYAFSSENTDDNSQIMILFIALGLAVVISLGSYATLRKLSKLKG